MKTVRERAWAKLNLSIDVLGKLDDGYHSMKMVMQSCELCDELTITVTEDARVRVGSNFDFLPEDERNIAAKAASLFFERIGERSAGAQIEILKRIPVCAGMGGGSADGAAVFRALNRLYGAGFDTTKLREMGAKLGSDVPFCVAGGTMLATGRGDVLTELPPLPDCAIVIIKPGFYIPTPKLFAHIDEVKTQNRPDTAGIVAALEERSLDGVARRMYNVFEDALPNSYSEVAQIKSRLLDTGALGVTMTGTGSAVFGIFRDEEAGTRALETFGGKMDFSCVTKPTRTIDI